MTRQARRGDVEPLGAVVTPEACLRHDADPDHPAAAASPSSGRTDGSDDGNPVRSSGSITRSSRGRFLGSARDRRCGLEAPSDFGSDPAATPVSACASTIAVSLASGLEPVAPSRARPRRRARAGRPTASRSSGRTAPGAVRRSDARAARPARPCRPGRLGAQAGLALRLVAAPAAATRASTASRSSGGSRSRSAGSRAGGDMPKSYPIGPSLPMKQGAERPG